MTPSPAAAPVASLRGARTARAALRHLAAEPFDGVVVSSTLGGEPDEARRVLAEVHARGRPALIAGRGPLNDAEAARYGATIFDRPLTSSIATGFLSLAGAGTDFSESRDSIVPRMLCMLEELRDRAGLTPTQTDVLVATAFGETRDDLRERLRVSDTTLRKHVSATLHKASAVGREAPTLDRLVCSLYVQATMQALDE